MPDISMCCNIDCPMKSICYRFRAKPSQMQAYGAFQYKWTPMDQHDSTLDYDCDDFWDCRDYDEKDLMPKDTKVQDLFEGIRKQPERPERRNDTDSRAELPKVQDA